MSENSGYYVDLLDSSKLGPEMTWVFRRMKTANERGEVADNTLRKEDYLRWAYVLRVLLADNPGQSLLDVGVGAGQFVNGAARAGFFSKVTAMDRERHSSFVQLTNKFAAIQKSLTMPQQNKLRHDIVTCMECLQGIKTTAFEMAVQNLRFLAKKRLIITVPFREPLPLPKHHFQEFDEIRLRELFPDAGIKLMAIGRKLQWAMVDIRMPSEDEASNRID